MHYVILLEIHMEMLLLDIPKEIKELKEYEYLNAGEIRNTKQDIAEIKEVLREQFCDTFLKIMSEDFELRGDKERKEIMDDLIKEIRKKLDGDSKCEHAWCETLDNKNICSFCGKVKDGEKDREYDIADGFQDSETDSKPSEPCEHQWDEIEPIECIICGIHKESTEDYDINKIREYVKIKGYFLVEMTDLEWLFEQGRPHPKEVDKFMELREKYLEDAGR